MRSSTGCSVFAFDCTSPSHIPALAQEAGISFYPWCVGRPQSMEGNVYTMGKNEAKFQFYPLGEIMKKLGHDRIDVLKMDIEGFEWGVFEQEILPLARAGRHAPVQILFELHTDMANPQFVPQRVVAGRDRTAVNSLFASLLNEGYYVVAIDVNGGDTACAEFAVLRRGSCLGNATGVFCCE